MASKDSVTPSSQLSIVIMGATGDLARKKLYAAAAALLQAELIPENVSVVGYGRRHKELGPFLAKQCVNVKGSDEWKSKFFFPRCSYFNGQGSYTEEKSLSALDKYLRETEGDLKGNRIFFLALPPKLFGPCTTAISKSCQSKTGFTRVIIEKPFGHDSKSFDTLNTETAAAFPENQIYRIDHYLGKEVIMNLLTLRFSNQIFEPLWNRSHIESVHINWKENLNLTGRAGYFDESGIIRDVMQNHLLQVLMFVAMERPKDMRTVTETKRELLKCVKTLAPSDAVLGQFTTAELFMDGHVVKELGYLNDPDIVKKYAGKDGTSITPTYAMAHLQIDNERWRGVPFIMSAGKGLDERVCDVRVCFKASPSIGGTAAATANELVIRIQPDEAIYYKINTKRPGLDFTPVQTVLDLSYRNQFKGVRFSDAYELCILNCFRGDRSLFVGADELVEAWRIWTPLVSSDIKPVPYVFGASAPTNARTFASKHGVTIKHSWQEFTASFASEATKLKELFSELDTNMDGKMNAEEFGALLKRFYDGREPPAAFVKSVIQRFDVDRDGEISFDEFLKVVEYAAGKSSSK